VGLGKPERAGDHNGRSDETAATAQRAVTSAAGEQSDDRDAPDGRALRPPPDRPAGRDVACSTRSVTSASTVRAAGDDTTYLPCRRVRSRASRTRIERYDGSTFRPVLRTSRVCVDGDGDERVFRVPAGVRVDRDRRTGGGRGGLRTDGGQSAATTARTLTVGDRVRVAGEQVTGGLATIERIDDSPPVASELRSRAPGTSFSTPTASASGCSSTRLRPTTTRSILRRPTPASTAPGSHKVPARGSNAWNARSYDGRDGVARVCSVSRDGDPVVRRRVHYDHDRPDRDAAVHYASIDQLILFCIVIIKWVPERVSGNVGETRRAGDHVCTTPMPAAELQPRLRPRSRTAADRRVGVNGRR